jgi:hypothetical protein
MVELKTLDTILSKQDLEFFNFHKTGTFGSCDVYSQHNEEGIKRLVVEPTFMDDIYKISLRYEVDNNNYIKKTYMNKKGGQHDFS